MESPGGPDRGRVCGCVSVYVPESVQGSKTRDDGIPGPFLFSREALSQLHIWWTLVCRCGMGSAPDGGVVEVGGWQTMNSVSTELW